MVGGSVLYHSLRGLGKLKEAWGTRPKWPFFVELPSAPAIRKR